MNRKIQMTTEMARLELRQAVPDLVTEVEEYLSFADIDFLTKEELIEDFNEYMLK